MHKANIISQMKFYLWGCYCGLLYSNEHEALGVNTPEDLAHIESIIATRYPLSNITAIRYTFLLCYLKVSSLNNHSNTSKPGISFERFTFCHFTPKDGTASDTPSGEGTLTIEAFKIGSCKFLEIRKGIGKTDCV